MNPAVLTLIVSLCSHLHGPDLDKKRNYTTYACTDQIKTCVEAAGPTTNYMWAKEEVSSCIGQYIKKNYRKRR